MTEKLEERELIERVFASALFRKSSRLSSFLSFIYEEYARGRGQHSSFAGALLRQRLGQYIETEGRNEHLIVSIPKGSYISAFRQGAIQPFPMAAPPKSYANRVAEEADFPRDENARTAKHRFWWMTASAVILLCPEPFRGNQ